MAAGHKYLYQKPVVGFIKGRGLGDLAQID